MLEGEAEKLLHMEERLHERIVDQEEAVGAVSEAIRRARAGLKDPQAAHRQLHLPRPHRRGQDRAGQGAGASSSSTTRTPWCASTCPSSRRSTPSRGSSARRRATSATTRAASSPRRCAAGPSAWSCFDEIEKAHPDVFNILLQILEDGRLTDGHGRTVDFKNTVVIMTSNLGMKEFQRQTVGFTPSEREEKRSGSAASVIEKALKKTFRPEFLNRIDEIIIFHPLTEANLKQIVDLLIKEVHKRLSDRGVGLELTEAAKKALVKEGYDPVLRGAASAPDGAAARAEPALEAHPGRRVRGGRHRRGGRLRRRRVHVRA